MLHVLWQQTRCFMSERAAIQDPAKAPAEQGRSLMGRLGLTLVAVLLFSISLSALLAYFNFEKRHRELISSRLQVMLDEVRLGIDYGTGLGLSMSALSETGEQLQALVRADPAIAKAAVYSAQGEVIFQAGHGDIQEGLPESWLALPQGKDFHAGYLLTQETERYLLVAEPLFNTFDIQSGLVVLAYSRDIYESKNQGLLKQQVLNSALAVIASAGIGLVLLGLMMRRLRQQILRLSGNLNRQLTGKVPEKSETPDELEARFQLLHDRLQDAQMSSADSDNPPSRPR